MLALSASAGEELLIAPPAPQLPTLGLCLGTSGVLTPSGCLAPRCVQARLAVDARLRSPSLPAVVEVSPSAHLEPGELVRLAPPMPSGHWATCARSVACGSRCTLFGFCRSVGGQQRCRLRSTPATTAEPFQTHAQSQRPMSW